MPHAVRGRKIKRAEIRPAGKETVGNKAEVEKTEALLVVEENTDEVRAAAPKAEIKEPVTPAGQVKTPKQKESAGDELFWPETPDEIEERELTAEGKTAAVVTEPASEKKIAKTEAAAQAEEKSGPANKKAAAKKEDAEADTKKADEKKSSKKKAASRKAKSKSAKKAKKTKEEGVKVSGKKEPRLKDNKLRHRRNRRVKALNLSVHQWIRFFSLLSVILAALVALAGITMYNHYKEYPVSVDRDSLKATDRGSDYIVLTWEEKHNCDVYKVFVKEHDPSLDKTDKRNGGESGTETDETWTELSSDKGEIKAEGLKENTSYSFIVRGDNAEHEGRPTKVRNFRTKKPQTITVSEKITKLTSSKPFKLDANAETLITYESSDTDVAAVNDRTGEIEIKGSGDAVITVKALATKHFEGDSKEVDLKVIDAHPSKAGGTSARIIYHLDSDNCDVVKVISGSGGAVIPQGLGYTGDKYIVSYGMGSPNRIISFDVDGNGKEVSVPKISLGHPNGFTYADENGLCYCVKGWSSRAVTYNPSTGKYGTVNLPYGCSGIGYDRKERLLYTCSRTVMAAYDISKDYEVVNTTGVVKHSGHTYTQDCGGHAGIMLRCLSGSNKHGINYIDLYDMKHGKYLGTISCDLSEVESAIVDNDGFLEILANNSSGTDYIWRTDINIETIGEGL